MEGGAGGEGEWRGSHGAGGGSNNSNNGGAVLGVRGV